jgi:hypothetical protein
MATKARDIANVIKKHRRTLISNHKVRRTGVGFKIKDGKITDDIGVVIFVRYKPSVEVLTQLNIEPIPKQIDGVVTDVVEIQTGFMPRISRLLTSAVVPDDLRHRPFTGGEAIINAKGEPATGTLGLIVQKSNDSSKLYGITNNHVGANEDVEGQPPTANKGDPWTQPGAHGGGRVPDDTIANLDSWNKLKPSGSGINNFYDCSLGEILNTSIQDAQAYKIADIGDVKGMEDTNLGDNVMKRGRTTLKTVGRVTAVSIQTTVDYQGIPCNFEDQVDITGVPETTPFSLPGDSGSLIVSSQKKTGDKAYIAKALLFAGGRGSDGIDHTIASPIKRIAADFNLKI